MPDVVKSFAGKVPRWFRCDYEPGDAGAAKALLAGEATPEQQKRFMLWLVNNACGYNEVAWEPENERATSFEAGRRFVAVQVIKITKLNLKDKNNE